MAAGAAPPLLKISVEEFVGTDSARETQSGTLPPARDQRVDLYMQMFYEEWDKPFWKELREQIPTDFGYYTGSGQWTEKQRSEAKEKGRPTLTLNHILPTINALAGLERMNRYDPKAAPKGKEDVELANIFTRLLRQTMEDTNGEYVLSSGFTDGCICGVRAYEMPIEYTDDPVKGDIGFGTVSVPDELMWSTPWKKYDLSDCRAMFRWKWVDVDLLLANYPKKRDEITAALNGTRALAAQDATRERATLTEGNPKNRYEASDPMRAQDDLLFWFDVAKNRVRVVDVYYPDYFPVWLLYDTEGSKVIRVTDEVRKRRLYDEIIRRNPDHTWTVLERNERRIQLMTTLPATGTVLEEGEPFKKDTATYPFVPFFAYWRGNEVFGVVRNLRDAQDEINARRSQISWLTKASGDGWFVDENSMTDVKSFEAQSRDPKGVYTIKKSASDPRRMPPPNVPQGLFEVLAVAVNEIRQISLVNSDMQGLRSDTVSGVAMKNREIQGQIGNNELYDNFKLTKRLIWKKMARRIQEKYKDEDVIRLFDPETGDYNFIEINKRVPEGQDGQEPSPIPGAALRYKILNDLSALKYDITMTETPSSPTHRQGALATLLDLIQKVPAAALLLIDVIVEMTDGLPDREKIVARFKQFVAAQSAPKPSEPPVVHVTLKGDDLTPEAKAILSDRAANQPAEQEKNPLGAGAGNAHNPSGQIPTGGQKLNERADIAPTPTG